MSQENVEVVRRFYEAWNAGDFAIQARLLDPDVVMQHAPGWPEPGPSVGREVVMRRFEQLRQVWEAEALETISFIDAGDRVVSRARWHGVGHGPDLNIEFAAVSTVSEGRVVLLELFRDHAEALEAVGLSE